MQDYEHELDLFLMEQEIDALLAERDVLKRRNKEIARKLHRIKMQRRRLKLAMNTNE